MTELSLHILDIVQNSISAKADYIKVIVTEDILGDRLTIEVSDNGYGMSEEFLKTVLDPFSTTRTTRKVGMGLSLFKAAAELTGGDLEIESKEGSGTKIYAWFSHKHIDRQPIGDMASTMSGLIMSNPYIEFLYKHEFNNNEFVLDTKEIRKITGEIIVSPEIILWIKEYIDEGLKEIKKDEVL